LIPFEEGISGNLMVFQRAKVVPKYFKISSGQGNHLFRVDILGFQNIPRSPVLLEDIDWQSIDCGLMTSLGIEGGRMGQILFPANEQSLKRFRFI
jgi:hypothetical protein